MKLNQKIISVLLLFTILSLRSSVALAEVSTPADVQFKPNSKPINPVSPDEDGGAIETNRPPTEGPLSINYASDIQFGKQKKSNEDEVFYANEDTIIVQETGEKKPVPNFVQVTDLRGTAGGWNLSVKQNAPFKNKNGAFLKGSHLTVSAHSIESMYGFKNRPSGLSRDQVLLEDGQAHEIVKAEKGTGVSTWTVFLGKENEPKSGISLFVPSEGVPEVGAYTTSLTWLLTDAL